MAFKPGLCWWGTCGKQRGRQQTRHKQRCRLLVQWML